jgi:hypothetical protein
MSCSTTDCTPNANIKCHKCPPRQGTDNIVPYTPSQFVFDSSSYYVSLDPSTGTYSIPFTIYPGNQGNWVRIVVEPIDPDPDIPDPPIVYIGEDTIDPDEWVWVPDNGISGTFQGTNGNTGGANYRASGYGTGDPNGDNTGELIGESNIEVEGIEGRAQIAWIPTGTLTFDTSKATPTDSDTVQFSRKEGTKQEPLWYKFGLLNVAGVNYTLTLDGQTVTLGTIYGPITSSAKTLTISVDASDQDVSLYSAQVWLTAYYDEDATELANTAIKELRVNNVFSPHFELEMTTDPLFMTEPFPAETNIQLFITPVDENTGLPDLTYDWSGDNGFIFALDVGDDEVAGNFTLNPGQIYNAGWEEYDDPITGQTINRFKADLQITRTGGVATTPFDFRIQVTNADHGFDGYSDWINVNGNIEFEFLEMPAFFEDAVEYTIKLKAYASAPKSTEVHPYVEYDDVLNSLTAADQANGTVSFSGVVLGQWTDGEASLTFTPNVTPSSGSQVSAKLHVAMGLSGTVTDDSEEQTFGGDITFALVRPLSNTPWPSTDPMPVVFGVYQDFNVVFVDSLNIPNTPISNWYSGNGSDWDSIKVRFPNDANISVKDYQSADWGWPANAAGLAAMDQANSRTLGWWTLLHSVAEYSGLDTVEFYSDEKDKFAERRIQIALCKSTLKVNITGTLKYVDTESPKRWTDFTYIEATAEWVAGNDIWEEVQLPLDTLLASGKPDSFTTDISWALNENNELVWTVEIANYRGDVWVFVRATKTGGLVTGDYDVVYTWTPVVGADYWTNTVTKITVSDS